jgi:hypothetical protein
MSLDLGSNFGLGVVERGEPVDSLLVYTQFATDNKRGVTLAICDILLSYEQRMLIYRLSLTNKSL